MHRDSLIQLALPVGLAIVVFGCSSGSASPAPASPSSPAAPAPTEDQDSLAGYGSCAPVMSLVAELRPRAAAGNWLPDRPEHDHMVRGLVLISHGTALSERPARLVEIDRNGAIWVADKQVDVKDPTRVVRARDTLADEGTGALYVIAERRAPISALFDVSTSLAEGAPVRLIGWLMRPTSSFATTPPATDWGKHWLSRVAERDDTGGGLAVIGELVAEGFRATAGGCHKATETAMGLIRGGGDAALVLTALNEDIRLCDCSTTRGAELALVLRVLVAPLIPSYGWRELDLSSLSRLSPDATVDAVPE